MKQILLFFSLLAITLFADAQPVITQNPQSTFVCVDSCKTLNITAVGNNLVYHWQKRDTNIWTTIASSNLAAFIFCADSIQDTVWMRCIVEETGLFDTSNVVYIASDSCLAPVANFTFEVNSDTVCFTNTSSRATTILWNFGDGNQSSIEQPCNVYSAIENYTVKLYVYNDFGTDMIEQDVNLIGLEEIVRMAKVFPNPSSGKVQIASKYFIENVALFDLQGNLVSQVSAHAENLELDFSAISKGVYFLKIQSGSDTSFQKIILR